ncbi:MAG: 6-bladed beta-propeller [Phycisphaerae bacterium]|nr:6-bladed beta-propeller [Phycisphaerae bacterium]
MTRRLRFVLALFVSGAFCACQQPQQPIFEQSDGRGALVWPAPPDAPRIRYIGMLSGEASLKARKTGGEVFRELLSGPIEKAVFVTPNAVAARGDRVYVADGQAGSVYELDLAARTFKSIRGAGGGPLAWPADVCLADDTLAVCDSGRSAVFLLDLDGRTRRVFGEGLLQRPSAVTYRRASGEWWVLDAALHAVIVFDRDGQVVRRFGTRGGGPGQFNFAAGLTMDARLGAVIADSMNFRVQFFDAEASESAAEPVRMFGRKGDSAGDFALPRDVAVDSDGHLYVLDSQFENVQIFEPDGRLLLAFGEEGDGPGQFSLPSGISIDSQDRIWVADTYNRRIQVFQYLREEGQ